MTDCRILCSMSQKMRVEEPDFAVIEAKVLTMRLQRDFGDARQFQLGFPLSTPCGGSGLVASGEGVPKAPEARRYPDGRRGGMGGIVLPVTRSGGGRFVPASPTRITKEIIWMMC
ncbi:MAG: hypothetical protein GY797_14335, partial [Deltaproteobacteria bacterium]|nr:hypothetical protein [Deltaproteobacteria bacterium]